MPIDWRHYRSQAFDELLEAAGEPRTAARPLVEYLSGLSTAELAARRLASELTIKAMGITFTVYSDGRNVDRAWPFDILPRVIPRAEWERTQAGLKQRVTALNCFIQDLYADQKIVKDRVFPKALLADSKNFRPQCQGVKPKGGVWAHVCGPELFETTTILPVDDYPAQLYETLAGLSPRPGDAPLVVVLTPGVYNSAYFEHAYLARQMGVELVEGSDLFVGDDDCCYMRTIYGPKRVDVIYRRIDDLFLDPETFRAESMVGVAGLMRAWTRGNVALANAPGAGVADDKVVYAFAPEMIRYYLDQDPILPNVPSYLCYREKDRAHVLAHLGELVVKPANESGGYGMLIGPKSARAEREKFRELIQADPRNYMAQPVIILSTAPTLTDDGLEPRHLDLRPFILSRDEPYVTTGGLTRVALVKGSLVVNSSQGGGSKDTWVVDVEDGG